MAVYLKRSGEWYQWSYGFKFKLSGILITNEIGKILREASSALWLEDASFVFDTDVAVSQNTFMTWARTWLFHKMLFSLV